VQGLHSFEPIECSPGLSFPVPYAPMPLLQTTKSKPAQAVSPITCTS
jgi:hypothetical protein